MFRDIPTIASGIMQAAAYETHQEVLVLLAEHIGMREIDGVPVQQWMLARQSELMQKHLLKLGDTNPEVYDSVVALIRASASKNKPS